VSLSQLRQEIDALDQQLLSLIDKRTSLARNIAAAKKQELDKSGHNDDGSAPSLLRPDREAALLRKLLATDRTSVSDAVVVQIWRGLISDSLRLQAEDLGGLQLYLCQIDQAETYHHARERLGPSMAMHLVDKPQSAIMAARDPRHMTVLSLDPRLGPWWAHLLAEPHVRIVASMPEGVHQAPKALMCAAISPQPTGHDTTFYVLDSRDSHQAVLEALSRRGLAGEILAEAKGLRLVSIAGFVEENDERLSALGAKGSALSGVIGAAAHIY